MNEFSLQLPGDITIGIHSTGKLPVTAKEELLLGAYLPDARILAEAPRSVDFTINHIESSEAKMHVEAATIELKDLWNDSVPEDLYHLLYSVARGLWQRKGIYPVHAACVGKDGDYILLPGHSGNGKSTTALTLVTDHGYKLLSGNTTLLKFDDSGNMQAVAGTKTMTLRTADFQQYGLQTKRSYEYGQRTAFELAVDEQVQTAQPITKITFVRLAYNVSEWQKLSPLSALHSLYPYVVDSEFADCVVAGGKAVYLGDTPPEARTNALRFLEQNLRDLSVYSGKGEVGFIAGEIGKL